MHDGRWQLVVGRVDRVPLACWLPGPRCRPGELAGTRNRCKVPLVPLPCSARCRLPLPSLELDPSSVATGGRYSEHRCLPAELGTLPTYPTDRAHCPPAKRLTQPVCKIHGLNSSM